MADEKLKGGEYVVIGDVLTLRKGTADKPTFDRHKRGETVKLTAAEANAYGRGSRPIVVPKARAADEQTDASPTPSVQGTGDKPGD